MTVHDVAAYILTVKGRMPAVKLHKLLYYSQAWSLVWDDRLLFRARIEAWANGPVVPAVYKLHRGHYSVKLWPSGDPKVLDKDATDTINAVIEFYGTKSSTWLSSLTHREDPWKNARGDLLPGQIGNKEITTAAMSEYYHSLVL